MPDVHLCGHTHIPVDEMLEGVRYIQWPLGNPKQQKPGNETHITSCGGFLCLFDGMSHGEVPHLWTPSHELRRV
jgi:hypothetical protein